MGLESATLDVQQDVRQWKILLARLTPNKRAEARNLGVSDVTVGRWCDPTRINENMPAPLLVKHSAANELLSILAQDMGKRVVELVDQGELNGCLTDERDQLLVLLGKLTERIMTAHTNRNSPGRIDMGEAFELVPKVKEIVRVAATLEAELNAIVHGEF